LHFLPLSLRLAEVLNHCEPRRFVVMCAVDSDTVYSRGHEIFHERVVCGGLARHRHHHPHDSSPFPGAEERVRIVLQNLLAFERRNPFLGWTAFGLVDQTSEYPDYGIRGVEDVALGPSEGRNSHQGKLILDVPDVLPSQGYILEQVAGARPPFSELLEVDARLQLQHTHADLLQSTDKLKEFGPRRQVSDAGVALD